LHGLEEHESLTKAPRWRAMGQLACARDRRKDVPSSRRHCSGGFELIPRQLVAGILQGEMLCAWQQLLLQQQTNAHPRHTATPTHATHRILTSTSTYCPGPQARKKSCAKTRMNESARLAGVLRL
jgi:hypothetical protein